MTQREQALTLLLSARAYKRESANKRRNAKLLMEAFHNLCERAGIDPAEIHRMQEAAEGNHGRN